MGILERRMHLCMLLFNIWADSWCYIITWLNEVSVMIVKKKEKKRSDLAASDSPQYSSFQRSVLDSGWSPDGPPAAVVGWDNDFSER